MVRTTGPCSWPSAMEGRHGSDVDDPIGTVGHGGIDALELEPDVARAADDDAILVEDLVDGAGLERDDALAGHPVKELQRLLAIRSAGHDQRLTLVDPDRRLPDGRRAHPPAPVLPLGRHHRATSIVDRA